jgi:hypothetical protein
MLHSPTIELTARLRRVEIGHEVNKAPMLEPWMTRAPLQQRTPVDLNIRVSLQPRLSFSIWVGRGVS